MDWSTLGAAVLNTVGEVASASEGTNVTPNATANTKGSWTEIVASTPQQADGIWVIAGFVGIADYLLSIAVGASGSEQTIIDNLYLNGASGGNGETNAYFFPIHIPAGTRIAAQSQASAASMSSVRLEIILLTYDFLQTAPLSRVTTYGAAPADSGGVSVDPGGTAHTKGAYSEIVASAAAPLRRLLVLFGNQANAARTTCKWLVDIAIGAGGSETIVVADLFVHGSGFELLFPQAVSFPVSIPAGSRLAVRAQCNITDATDRLFDVILYGVD